MLKHLLFLLVLVPITALSQDSLFVKLNPQGAFDQISMFRINGAHQAYVTNAKSEDGNFKFEFPPDATAGMYRLFFDLQNGLFFEVLYNNETIAVEFDPSMPDDTAVFSSSEENKVYQTYIQQIGAQQYKLDSLQYAYFNAPIKQYIRDEYPKELQKLYELQDGFEKQAVGLMTMDFIKGNEKYYNPEIIESLEAYMLSMNEHFFDYVDFSNDNLTSSSFFIDKVIEYVFYMNSAEDQETDATLKEQVIAIAMDKIGDINKVKNEVISSLIYAFAQQQNIELVSYIEENYYKTQPQEFQDERFLKQIHSMIKIAIGMTAPEITWTENEVEKKLSELSEAEKYVVVFWSTTCSHCLDEIPLFYNYSESLPNVKVIAVALEEDAIGFKNQIKTMPNWINVLGLDKWENEFARSYDINATPSYFVLDSDKKILAKPDTFEDVIDYFSE